MDEEPIFLTYDTVIKHTIRADSILKIEKVEYDKYRVTKRFSEIMVTKDQAIELAQQLRDLWSNVIDSTY